MTILEALRQTTTSIKSWAEGKFLNKNEATADDFGVYVQDTEPVDAVAGDIWIDTANDPTVMQTGVSNSLPSVTVADNGKVLMVVNGTWQMVNLNLSLDADGVMFV